jgi:hypothetical protein
MLATECDPNVDPYLKLPTNGSADAQVVLIGPDGRFAVKVFVNMKTPVEVCGNFDAHVG